MLYLRMLGSADDVTGWWVMYPLGVIYQALYNDGGGENEMHWVNLYIRYIYPHKVHRRLVQLLEKWLPCGTNSLGINNGKSTVNY